MMCTMHGRRVKEGPCDGMDESLLCFLKKNRKGRLVHVIIIDEWINRLINVRMMRGLFNEVACLRESSWFSLLNMCSEKKVWSKS
jgi:hypothetical protein